MVQTEKLITLFMLVTDRDCMIADYAVGSYRKIYRQKKAFGFQDFVLFVYLNCLSERNILKYKKKWESYPYTTVFDNANKISGPARPYPGKPIISPEGVARSCDDYAESYDELWTTELKKFKTPFVATVDADFEVLHPDFYFYLCGQLRQHADIIAASSSYTGTGLLYDSYSKRNIILTERNHTWFCIYKREAFAISARSHYYFETLTSKGEILAYDSAAYFQHDLRINHRYRFAVLPERFRYSYIHYGAASKNRSLNSSNIGFYRRAVILNTVGCVYGIKSKPALLINKITRKIAFVLFGTYLNKIVAERSRYIYA